jgi:hypothetical protein
MKDDPKRLLLMKTVYCRSRSNRKSKTCLEVLEDEGSAEDDGTIQMMKRLMMNQTKTMLMMA